MDGGIEMDLEKVKTGLKEDLYIEQLDATITILQPDRSTVMDSIESESDELMVYNIVVEPNLKDTNLHNAYGCAEPIEIVTKIFNPGSVAGIAKAGLKLAGYESKVSAVKDLKN